MKPAGAGTGQSGGQAGKSLNGFDPCSVVSDSEYLPFVTARVRPDDGTAPPAVHITHGPTSGEADGFPGSKACKLTYTATDSTGTSKAGADDEVTVTFDEWKQLDLDRGSNPKILNDYQSAGAEGFSGFGSRPHITKNGYLFSVHTGDDNEAIALAIGIAKRL